MYTPCFPLVVVIKRLTYQKKVILLNLLQKIIESPFLMYNTLKNNK